MTVPRHLAAAAAALALALPGCSHETSRAKHLLLISVDTLNAEHLGCYGGPNRPSPAIDRLAAEGVRFERAYVPRGMTLASMATYFTSKFPAETGVLDNVHKLSRDELTLAERLEKAGYRRIAFNASEILNETRGTRIDQGYKDKAYLTRVGATAQDRLLATDAAQYLKTSFGKNPKPEYLWIHLVAPHKPYEPPPSVVAKLDPGYRGKLEASGTEQEAAIEAPYLTRTPLDAADKKHADALYDGEVATVDDCVAVLMAALDESGAAKDTLVVFVADHGEELFEHNLYPYHANSPYRCVTRVPWIFRQPGAVDGGKTVPDVVQSVDLVPTVLAWLGQNDLIGGDSAANAARGRDLSKLLAGGSLPEAFAFGRIDDCADRPNSLGVATIRDKKWSLVVNADGWCPAFPPKGGSYPIPPLALYDLDVDPHELQDVSAAHPDVVARLRPALESWVAGLATRTTDAIDLAKDPQQIKMMQQQGYLGGAVSSEPQRARCVAR